MKITNVKWFALKIGIRCRFIVKVETDAGIHGLGEAGTAGRERALGGTIDHFREFLIGKDPRQIEDIHQTLYRSQYFEGGTIITAAASAIDIALWDILGKHLRVPVWQLLGGASRQHVTCFADGVAGEGETCQNRRRTLLRKAGRRSVSCPKCQAEGSTNWQQTGTILGSPFNGRVRSFTQSVTWWEQKSAWRWTSIIASASPRPPTSANWWKAWT